MRWYVVTPDWTDRFSPSTLFSASQYKTVDMPWSVALREIFGCYNLYFSCCKNESLILKQLPIWSLTLLWLSLHRRPRVCQLSILPVHICGQKKNLQALNSGHFCSRGQVVSAQCVRLGWRNRVLMYSRHQIQILWQRKSPNHSSWNKELIL